MSDIKIHALDIKRLRKRHNITQKQLADSLYGVKLNALRKWEDTGKHGRNCTPIVFWAMVLTFDKVDLYEYGLDNWRKDFNMPKEV